MFKKRNLSGNKTALKPKEIDEEEDDTVVVKDASNNVASLGLKIGGKSTEPEAKSELYSKVATIFESSKDSAPMKYVGDATYTNEIDTSTDRDARAILERNMKLELDGTLENSETAIYRGKSAYKSYTTQDPAKIGANKFTGTQGPIRAPTFLRSTVRIDYQPDTCKDFKETGYCGFGNSCKFMHDRHDYKAGWQIDREWDKEQEKKKLKLAEESFKNINDGGNDGEENNPAKVTDNDNLPFACHICRNNFTNPVITVCNHYFCGNCIMQHNKSNPKCPICDKPTFGVYNKAIKLIKKLQKDKDEQQAPVVQKSCGSWEDVTD